MVQRPQDLCWCVAMPGTGTDRVAGEPGERSSSGACSADISDDHGPLSRLIEREHVVEIASHVDAFSRRPVPDCDLDPWNRRQGRRQQALLECVGDTTLLLLKAQILDAGSDPVSNTSRERNVVVGVSPR